jgi:spermidine synthase
MIEEPLGGGELHAHQVQRVLLEGRTRLQRFQIVELSRYGRAMVIEGRVQSTEQDEYIYHESLIYPAYVLRPRLRRVLCLGGANGGMLRELRKLPGFEEVVLIDVDPELCEASKQHLPHMHRDAFRDARFQVGFGSIRSAMMGMRGRFDAIFADLPDATAEGETRWLFTLEFYRDIQALLEPAGIFVTQAGAASHLHGRFFASVLRTAREVFRYATPYAISVPSYGVPWGFVMASDGSDPGALNEQRIASALASLEQETLRSYDLVTHRHMFNLPRALREVLEREGGLSRDGAPIPEGAPPSRP